MRFVIKGTKNNKVSEEDLELSENIFYLSYAESADSGEGDEEGGVLQIRDITGVSEEFSSLWKNLKTFDSSDLTVNVYFFSVPLELKVKDRSLVYQKSISLKDELIRAIRLTTY